MPLSISLTALPFDAFIAFAVFCRVGGMFMTAPAFGDFSLSPRLRLTGAIAVSAALVPALAPQYPNWAANGLSAMAGIVLGEIFLGVMIGLAARIFMSALNVAGQIIAFQMGLSLAQIFDPTQDLQGAIIGGFLAVLGTTLIFATDLHHVLLLAVKDSYLLFTPGTMPAMGDVSTLMIDALSTAFALGMRLSAPFILFGLVFYVGAGVLNRLMPQAQVFFMLLPANLMLGLGLLMLSLSLMMTVFLTNFETFIAGFLG